MSSSVPPVKPTPQSSSDVAVSPLAIGWTIQLFLSGIALRWFYEYASSGRYNRDPRITRISTWIVVVSMTISACLAAVATGQYAANKRGNSNNLYSTTTPIQSMQALAQGIVNLVVQIYMARRGTTMIDGPCLRHLLFLICVLLSITSFAGAIATAIIVVQTSNGAAIERDMYDAVLVWMVFSATSDVLWGTIISIKLAKSLGALGSLMKTVIRKLIRFAIVTASYTTIGAVIGGVMATILREKEIMCITTTIPLCITAVLTPLYTFTLLHTLSSRDKLCEKLRGDAALASLPFHSTAEVPFPAKTITLELTKSPADELRSGSDHPHPASELEQITTSRN